MQRTPLWSTIISDIFIVTWSSQVAKKLEKLPKHIERKFFGWVASVQFDGLRKTKALPGYHDEPLKGNRFGQRSVRLNRAYRAIYIERNNGVIEFIEILEVNKHAY